MGHKAYAPLLLGALFTLVASIACLMSVISDDWVAYEQGKSHKTLGLWQARDEGNRVTLPYAVSINILFQTTRAFVCMGTVFILLAGIVCMLFACLSRKRPLSLVASVALFIGAFCFLIGVAIFTPYYNNDDGQNVLKSDIGGETVEELYYGWGYALALVAFFFALFGGIAMVLAAVWAGGESDFAR